MSIYPINDVKVTINNKTIYLDNETFSSIKLKVSNEIIDDYQSLKDENGVIIPYSVISKEDDNSYISFDSTGQKEYIFCNDEPDFIEAKINTFQISEGDRLHITANDNGSFVIADKYSGNTYFEFPTITLVNDNLKSSAIRTDVQKKNGHNFDLYIIHKDFALYNENGFFDNKVSAQLVMNILHCYKDNFITIDLKFKLFTNSNLNITFPLGIEYGTPIFDSEYIEENGKYISLNKNGNVSILNEAGEKPVEIQANGDISEISTDVIGNINILSSQIFDIGKISFMIKFNDSNEEITF